MLLRRQRRLAPRRAALAFVAVLTIGLLTGWWLNAMVDPDLSAVATLPAEMGFSRSTDAPHPPVGFVATLADDDGSLPAAS
jgi:hypothetical protein